MSLYRILAIDYGEKRVGIALSDPLRIISKPFCVLENKNELFDEIQKIISEQQVEKIVLGIPYNLKGEDSFKTIEVKQSELVIDDYKVVYRSNAEQNPIYINNTLKEKVLS